MSDNFFVVHVPLEYDYLFVSGRKTEIISVLRQAFTEATNQELSISMQNMYVIQRTAIDHTYTYIVMFVCKCEGVNVRLYILDIY